MQALHPLATINIEGDSTMRLHNLLANLGNPDPLIRGEVARVLGMVYETQALHAIIECYKSEPEPRVREIMSWAGKRLYDAQKRGYSTTDEIFEYFQINRELENIEDEAESALMEKMQQNLDIEMIRRKQSAAQKTAGMAAAAGLAGAMIGGSTLGMGLMGSALQPGAEASSSSLGQDRPAIGKNRTPATMPSNTDITLWLKRLKTSEDPMHRATAARELLTINNPAALPHLAAVLVSDPDPQVRDAAQSAAHVLYLNTVYWHMEQDGTLLDEMQKRATALGKTLKPSQRDQIEAKRREDAPKAQEDIAAILQAAEKARKKRRRGS
jgi:HEAT repeat protein